MGALLERDAELSAIAQVIETGGVLVIEGGAGIGKTSLLAQACDRAADADVDVLRARGSELEGDFAFGVVRQLLEKRLAAASPAERERLLAGAAAAAEPLLGGAVAEPAPDSFFAVVHGLYWFAANLAGERRVVLVVDDAHWADEPSLRWLAYLADRLEDLPLSLLVALRPHESAADEPPLQAVRGSATAILRPRALTGPAVTSLVRTRLGDDVTDDLAAAIAHASGGNPFYVLELLRGADAAAGTTGAVVRASEDLSRYVAGRIGRLDADALRLAQALAVLGDGCEVRHAAALAALDMRTTLRLAAELVRLEILSDDDPPQFLHPVLRHALEASLSADGKDAAHRRAARLLYDERATPGVTATHVLPLRPAGDSWVVSRLREGAQAARASNAPTVAAAMLRRALAEPPLQDARVDVLREAAQAETALGRESAFALFDEAHDLVADTHLRAEIGLEQAESYAGAFRWVEAADVCERTLAELGEADTELVSRIEGELVVCGLRDSRRAVRVRPVLDRLGTRALSGGAAEAYAVGRAIDALWFAGRPAAEVASGLADAFDCSGPRPANWDIRAPGLWALVVAEGFDAAQRTLSRMVDEVQRSGSARGLFVTYALLSLLQFRLGALPDADGSSRIAVRVMEAADFTAGLPLGLHVLADVAIEAGDLDQAQTLLGQLPRGDYPAGLGTAHIAPARGRLLLAQGRYAEALAQFEAAAELLSAAHWGIDVHDNGFTHARSGAALALHALGQRDRGLDLAESELADARVFGGARALGIALRTTGLLRGGDEGLALLEESAAVLEPSPALLERAHSLVALGAARRRAGQRAAAREPLAEGLDLAARCGASPLAGRARDELVSAGARPRRDWRTGVEALTPTELRVARLAAEGKTNREIAQALYVTLKTVEGHLARAYTKLGISGRPELTGAIQGENTRVPTR